jgi:hypothetical protein
MREKVGSLIARDEQQLQSSGGASMITKIFTSVSGQKERPRFLRVLLCKVIG